MVFTQQEQVRNLQDIYNEALKNGRSAPEVGVSYDGVEIVFSIKHGDQTLHISYEALSDELGDDSRREICNWADPKTVFQTFTKVDSPSH